MIESVAIDHFPDTMFSVFGHVAHAAKLDTGLDP